MLLWTTLMNRAAARENGQALVEYALIVSLVALVAVAALKLLGGNVTTALNSVAVAL
jgi:Flp pilus assembly pilin Flp